MNEYIELFKTFAFTGQTGFWTYWLPTILCFIGYTGRTWYQIRELKRPKKDSYDYSRVPRLTVGTIIGRLLLSITPWVNIIALVFGLSYDMVSKVSSWVGKVLSFELVKNRT